MATPTLDAYRQLNPQDTRSDTDLVPELISRLSAEGSLSQYPDLVQHASDMEREYRQSHRPSYLKEFGAGLASGIDQGQGQLYSAVGQAGDVFGVDAVRDFGLKGYVRNQQEAAENAPTVGSYEDIHGVDDAVRYGIGLVGQQAPQIAATFAGTGAGAIIGGAVGGPAGAATGAAIGGGAAGYLQNQNYADLALSGGEDPAMTAAIVGSVSGYLETLVPGQIINRAFGAAPRSVVKMGMQELLQRAEAKIPGLAASMLKASAKDSASEAMTEVAQELTAMAGELYSNRNNPNFEISDKELTDRIVNNALGGAVLGGVFGATEGPGHRKEAVELQHLAKARLEQQEKEKIAAKAGFITPTNLLLDERYNAQAEAPVTEPLDERYTQPYEALFDKNASPERVSQVKAAINEQQRTADLLDERYNVPPEPVTTRDVVDIPNNQVQEPTPPLDFGGEFPVTPTTGNREVLQGAPPSLRKEVTYVPVDADKAKLEELGNKDIRKDEYTKDSAKKMVAVQDTETGKVHLWGVYKSTGGRLMVDNGVDAKITSRAALAEALGVKARDIAAAYKTGGSTRDAYETIMTEANAGAKLDQPLEAFSKPGRYKPLGFVALTEPVARRHFIFNDREEFQRVVGYDAEQNIQTKGNKLGGFGIPQIIARLTKISPDDSRAVQVLATVLENITNLHEKSNGGGDPEDRGYANKAELRARADATLILENILGGPRAERFAEELAKTKTPSELFRSSKGRYFALFTPDEWAEFKALTKKPDVTAQELLGAVDRGLAGYGWGSRFEYLKQVSKEKRQSQLGEQLMESDTGESDLNSEDADDNLSASMIESAGREGAGLAMQADSAPAQNDIPAAPDAETLTSPRAQSVTGTGSIIDALTQLGDEFIAPKRENAEAVRNIKEARADSEISANPKEDYEFQAVKEDLKKLVAKLFYRANIAIPEAIGSDDFLYGVYSNLDKVIRDSQSFPATYRVTSDEIQNKFYTTVAWLGDKGVDVRLVKQATNSAVEMLQKEWGRSISSEDGHRVIILTMADLSVPTADNLRMLYHEVAHQQFADMPADVQRILHESVDRLTSLKLDVFSKTYDARIKNQSLPGSVLLEEVLAEHLAFYGVENGAARGLVRQFIDGVRKAFASAVMLYSTLRGIPLSPEWAIKYSELRFRDMLDRRLSPRTDLDTLTGNIRNTAVTRATFFTPTDGGFEAQKFNAATGYFEVHSVVDDSALASEINLDNRLQFSDVVVRDSRAEPLKEYWKKTFGVSEEPAKLADVLDNIRKSTDNIVNIEAAKALSEAGKYGLEATVRFVKDAADIDMLRELRVAEGAAAYVAGTHEILIDPNKIGGYSPSMFSDLVIHEAQHAATARAITTYNLYKTLGNDAEAVAQMIGGENLSPEAYTKLVRDINRTMPHAERVDAIFKHMTRLKENGRPFAEGEYGLTSLDEFMSEVMSNRSFQMKLARVTLPESLRVVSKIKSAFKNMVELVHRILGINAAPNSALESAVAATEKFILGADFLLSRPSDRVLFAPVSEAESDARVKRDFEYRFAELNSQGDFYHAAFDGPAAAAKQDFDAYLSKMLGIFNPEKGIRELELKAGSRSRPIPVNQELRLNDSKGSSNRVESKTDRDQITKQVVETASAAQGRMAGRLERLNDAIPKMEKQLEKTKERFVRFDTMLHDVTTIRDNALKILRNALRGAERNAARLVQWSTRHDGLGGVAAELFGVSEEEAIPEDYLDLIVQSVDDHQSDLFITDTLTAAAKAGIDFDALSPRQIKQRIEEVARSGRDPNLLAVADDTPQAKADLSLLIYYAKTAPEDMAALAVRVEKDPERKEEILSTIKRIIRGNYESTEGLNDLFKQVRRGDVRVGKAKASLSEAARQMNQVQKQLEIAKVRVQEMNNAAKILTMAAKPYQAELGIRASRFEPADGQKVILTKNGEISRGTLKLGPGTSASVNQILMDNIAWLRAHEAGTHDDTYLAVQDQIEGLKKVAGEELQSNFRDSWMNRFLGSLPERLNAVGLPILRRAGDRLVRNFSLRQEAEPIVTSGLKVTEDFNTARKAAGFENSYQGFKDVIWNPAFHFLRHLTLVPGANEADNRAYAKDQLKTFFMRSELTRDIVRKGNAFDSIWTALETNAKTSKAIANKAAAWGVFVEDSDIKIVNARTGRLENAQRPAMDVGLMTTQTDIRKIFGIKDLLDQVKDQQGNSIWAEWAENNKLPADLKQLFTDEALRRFVDPYIYDTGTLHLNAPALLDGKTRNRANPMNVQAAYEASNGDMVKFATDLFASEYTLQNEAGVDHGARQKAFVEETLGFFQGQYKKIRSMSEKQETFRRQGMDMLSTPMMDSVKSMDFPAEFVDYYVYDHTTTRNIVSQLAAHGSLGRDLGYFEKGDDTNRGIMWEFAQAADELKIRGAEYSRLREGALRDNPRASVKEIDDTIKEKVGEEKFVTIKNLDKARQELSQIEKSVITYFVSPNGATRDMTLAQTAVGTLSGFMVNNFKSAINSVYQAFEPFMIYGVGKTGWKQATRYIEAAARSGAGSLIQAVAGQAHLASEYARYMSELGLGRDPGNEVTASQIIADTGKNNIYEDRRLLGWLRKGRALAFDTGFRGAEGERIAPKFRPQAPFSVMMIALNQGAIESELRLYDQVLKQGIDVMDQVGAKNDPSFQFTHEHIKLGENSFDKLAFDELKHELKIMGTTLEIETRALIAARDGGLPLGNIVVPPHLARLIAGEAMRRMSLPSDISSSAVWMHNSPMGRLAMPLISWSLNKVNQIMGAVREPNGEASRRAMVAGIASLALGMVPAAILISMLTDQYDERVLGKKSNLVGFNFENPSQTAVALMERVGRVGTFGMAGDLVNGVRVYGTSGDLRGLSIDQRVVFVNTLMSVIGLASTAYNQEGTLTYDTFYRPLLNTMGGGGILQNQQILNNITNTVMGVPIFQAESETTARLNALNYLRGAGRVTGLDVRSGSGMRTLPNPTKPWVNQMVVATYSNNRSEFVDAYNRAIASAREEGKPDPEEYVKQAYSSYHPLRYTFSTPPSGAEVSNMMAALTDKGRVDVQSALNSFNSYAQSLGLKPYNGKVAEKAAGTKTAPNPWAGVR